MDDRDLREEVLAALKSDHRVVIDKPGAPISHHGAYEVLAKVTEGLWKAVADLAREVDQLKREPSKPG
jgi:hypothetical protein